jgi:anti-sigma regulatory factor (Ser/Thr protein kinase)
MWDCQPAIDTLELILSEVVSNAVVHARSEPEVSVRLLEGFLRVEVADDSDAMPEVRPVDEMDTGGRGLRILTSESTRWGIAPRPGGGKAVWFEVPIFGSG